MSPSKFRAIVDDEKKLLTDLCEKWERLLTIDSETVKQTTAEEATEEQSNSNSVIEEGPPSSRTRSKVKSQASTATVDAKEGDTDASSPANEQQSLLEPKPVVIEDEEVIGLVRSTTGQGRMLLRERFVQFEQLINDAENNTSDKPIRDDDLQGFWDMIGFQVDDMKERFQVLEYAEANDWKLPEAKKERPKPAPKPKVSNPVSSSTASTSRTKKAAPSSGMKDFIAQKRLEAAAARKKQQQEEAEAGE